MLGRVQKWLRSDTLRHPGGALTSLMYSSIFMSLTKTSLHLFSKYIVHNFDNGRMNGSLIIEMTQRCWQDWQ